MRIDIEQVSKFPDGPLVYSCFSASGELLYIGVTKSLKRRFSGHRSNSAWHCLSRHVELQEFDTMIEAYAAEAAAILHHKPPFNIQLNRNPDRQRITVMRRHVVRRAAPAIAAGAVCTEAATKVQDLRLRQRALIALEREAFSEMKAKGYNVSALRHVLKERAMDPDKKAEDDAVTEMYRAALGMS